MGRRVAGWVAVAVLLVGAGQDARASSLITFDDWSPANQMAVGPLYDGLRWKNVWITNQAWNGTGNGYAAGTVSSPNAAWVPADAGSPGTATATITGDNPFTFQSAALTSAWVDGMRLQVNGYRDGQLVDAKTLFLKTDAPTVVNFDWQNIDTVMLGSAAGVAGPSWTGGFGPQFVLDDVSVDLPGTGGTPPNVPEPPGLAVAALLGAGGWLGVRRSRAGRAGH